MLVVAGLLLGAAGSLHCVLMCGPLVAAAGAGTGTWRARATAFLVYHGGRGLVYLALAAMAALFGRAFALAGFGGALSVTCGLLMLGVALPTRLVPRRLVAAALRPLGGASAKVRALARTHPLGARFMAGVVNGFLPCGLTYAAALTAATLQSVAAATLFMGGFWAGTVPALAAVSISAAAIPRLSAARLRWLAPVVMAIVGLLLIVRGLEPLRQPPKPGAAAPVHHHGM
ncbi:MAG: sulfite exporter TauE/SafE family protein [Acidobacteriota bacterium]